MAHLALAGGPRRRGDKKWPDWPIRGAEERALVDEVVTTGPWSYEGPREKEFEATFAAYCGARSWRRGAPPPAAGMRSATTP